MPFSVPSLTVSDYGKMLAKLAFLF